MSEHVGAERDCDHDSHYMTEDDGHDHWRCLRCGCVTDCGTCVIASAEGDAQ